MARKSAAPSNATLNPTDAPFPPGTSYWFVCNIPANYRAVDLRAHFSDLVEEEAFTCFHYRHRNELSDDPATPTTKCCPVALCGRSGVGRLLAVHGKAWTNRDGEQDVLKVMIRRVDVEGASVGVQPGKYQSRREKRDKAEAQDVDKPDCVERVSASVFFSLPEFHPPQETPQGNVGTCMRVFRQLLGECRLPPSVITKLGLVFVRDLTGRPYGDVPFVYPDGDDDADEEDDAEEWDRYEALHDDVAVDTERAKEHLYEEEMEVIWDKGHPGLVWHTDAATWQEGEDSDPDLVDFDMDTRIHYKHNPAWLDTDTRQRAEIFRKEAEEQAARAGDEDILTSQGQDERGDGAAPFETHTRGVGSKLLRKHGWRPGQGVGASGREGIRTPVEAGGKTPGDKSGLGTSSTAGKSKTQSAKSSAYRARYVPVAEPLAAREPSPPAAPKEHVEEVPVPEEVLPPRRKPKLILDDAQRELERQRGLLSAQDSDAEDRKRPLEDDPIPEGNERGFVKYREVAFVKGAIQPPAEVKEPFNPNPRFIDPYFNMQEPMPLTRLPLKGDISGQPVHQHVPCKEDCGTFAVLHWPASFYFDCPAHTQNTCIKKL